jgi:hypothetical protein
MTRDLSSYPSSWIIFAVTSLTFKTIAARYLCNTSSRARWCNSRIFCSRSRFARWKSGRRKIRALRQLENSKNRNNRAVFTVGAFVSAPTTRARVLCHFFRIAAGVTDGSAIYVTPPRARAHLPLSAAGQSG